LYIYGKDISSKLHREDRDKQHPNQSDSEIVMQLINSYANLGLKGKVTKTDDVPAQSDRVPSQQCSDLDFIRQRAQHNGYVFYVEPTAVGESTAYWGPDNRSGEVQPPLTLNMGPDTNVDDPPNVDFDAMGPVEPEVSFIDPITKRTIHVPLPASLHPSLAKQPTAALRKTLPRNTANLNFIQALLKASSTVNESSDAVTVNDEVDAVRYGRVLRARRLVKVRGVGQSYDGTFYVKEVVHSIRRGEYKQRFKLIREGRGAA
jgi:phage protein D